MDQPRKDALAPSERDALDCLDDGALLSVLRWLNPMPDVFNLARTCLRLKRLAHDQRNNLVVGAPPHLRGPNHYHTLQAAVSASRPGDCISIMPGVHTVLAHPIVVHHALHITAGGASAELSVVCGQQGHAEPTLDIRSTCKITNLTILSPGAGPCILHRGGQLHLERLHLRCSVADGLAHLCSPIVTTAGGLGASAGRLSVVECTMAGGEKAVACKGSGSPQSVRAVYQERKTWLYLEVDGRTPTKPLLHAPAALLTHTSMAQSRQLTSTQAGCLDVDSSQALSTSVECASRGTGPAHPAGKKRAVPGSAHPVAGTCDDGPVAGLAKMARLLADPSAVQAFSEGLSNRAKHWCAQPALEKCAAVECSQAAVRSSDVVLVGHGAAAGSWRSVGNAPFSPSTRAMDRGWHAGQASRVRGAAVSVRVSAELDDHIRELEALVD